MLHAYAHTRSSRLSEIGLINKRAGPAAISFKKTSENGVYVGGAAPAPEPETRPGGKNRKPLYKLIPRGRGRARGRRTDRRINTFPHPAPTTVSFYTCVSRSRVAPPPFATVYRSLSRALRIDCLGGKAIFINANEQYEWVFRHRRPAKAFTTNEIFRARRWRARAIGAGAARALETCAG